VVSQIAPWNEHLGPGTLPLPVVVAGRSGCPRQDSNLRTRLRRAVLYPLSYGGPATAKGYQDPPGRFRPAGGAAGSYGGRMPERTPRVLVVDDEAVIRQLIAINLELEGFEVHQAVDGSDAVDKARTVDPDVVTLDVMMPGLDGWATAQRLRADSSTSRARIVMISARTRPADIERGRDSGADEYVTKPFDPDEVVAAVRRLVPT
jgi:CheY-like chemotaxis protein